MPSASTSKPMSASTPIVSSLCSRTRPTSLKPTERILPRTSVYSDRDIALGVRSWQQPFVFGLRRFRRGDLLCDGAQRGAEFGARRIAVVCRFGERSIEDGFDALR